MRAMSRQTPAGMSSMKNVAAAACEMAVMMRMPDRSRSRSAPPRVARGAERHEQERHGEAGCQQSRLHARRRPGLPHVSG